MSLNAEETLDATKFGSRARFINHSCDPNAVIDRWHVDGFVRIGFFTRRSVKKGEEITIDYEYENEGSHKNQKCFCGSANCRGEIIAKRSTKTIVSLKTVVYWLAI